LEPGDLVFFVGQGDGGTGARGDLRRQRRDGRRARDRPDLRVQPVSFAAGWYAGATPPWLSAAADPIPARPAPLTADW
jgi:hypothetical protein